MDYFYDTQTSVLFMYPTLFHIPTILFGHPLFGHNGLLIWVVLASTLAAVAVRCFRRGWDGECWSYITIGAVAMLVVRFIVPVVITDSGGLPIRGYGLFLLLGIVCSFGLLYWRLKRKGYFSTDLLFSMALWTVVGGILGARLFYVIEYRNEMIVFGEHGGLSFLRTVLNIVNIAEGGLVVYGSILAGTATAIGFMLWNRLPVFKTLDLLAPSLLLGMAFGRIGCFMNGCCFGAVCPVDYRDYGVVFPENSPAHRHQVEMGIVPFLGLEFQDVPTDANPAVPNAVEIKVVVPGSPAEKAGLKPGIRIKAIGVPDGSRITANIVTNATQAGRQLIFFANHPPGTAAAEHRHLVLIGEAPAEQRYHLEVGEHDGHGHAGREIVLPVWPMQLISSAGNLLLCVVLLLLSRVVRRDGLVFNAFLFLYPVMRFGLEIFRDDEPALPGIGLTISQTVSIPLFLTAIVLFFVLMRNHVSPRTE